MFKIKSRATKIMLCVGVVALSGASMMATAQLPTGLTGFGTTPVFDEEFNGSALNTAVWSYRGTGVRAACNMTPAAVAISNGYAHISIYSSGGSNYCGAISTDHLAEFGYGYYEANVRYHFRSGMQCSFWLQSDTMGSIIGNPQQSGIEMDVFEHNAWTTSSTGYDESLHWNGYGAYLTSSSHNTTLSNLNDGNFHKFGIAWTPSSYTFYVDGTARWTQSSSQAPISNILQYMILDTELPGVNIPSGGYGALGDSNNPWLDIDYVHVYPYSATVTTTTLSPVADAYVRDGIYSAENFGGSDILNVKADATGYNRNSYLKFDLTGITGTVRQATLYMTPVSVGEANITNKAYTVSDNTWTANTITWDTQPSSPALLSTGINYGANILTNFDVTANAAAGQLYSVKLGPGSPTGGPTFVGYAAQEHATANYRPTLVVLTTP
jgi:beta-glucanase (GH16 family)